MKKLFILLFILSTSFYSFGAVTALTLNLTATGWATTSGRTTGDISVTNAANRGYAVFDLSTLSIPAGCVVSTVTLGFTITAVGGASTPTCTIYGYVGDISSLSATSIYNACTTGTTAIYTATWGTVAASPKTMATTAAAVSFVSSNLSNTISVCWVESASTRTYAINGSTSPVPVLTVSYCNAPTAVSITATPNPVCSGSSLTLTGAATGATGGTFTWTGPNSFSSTLQNPTAFTTSTLSAGVYSFTATSACGSSAPMATKAVTVNTASPTAITGGSATLCGATGYTMNLSDAVPGGVWTSSAPANATINSVTGVLTSVTTGATTVSYTTGCGSPATLTVTVRAIPTVVVNNPAASACYGGSASITASGGTTYTWAPSAGLSGTATATVTATPTSTTTYTVTGTTSGCSATATSTITGSTSEAIFSVTATASPATTCSGGTSTLYENIANSNYNTVTSITYAAVATTGTAVLAGEDDNYVTVTIPFTFNFYGVNYTSVNICTNGFINFGTPSTSYSPAAIPDYSNPEGLVALFFHDLDVSAGGNIKYTTTGTTPNRKFIVSYNGVSDYGGGSTNTGQIILYETSNNIDILLASVTEAGAATVATGVQDLTGTYGVGAPGRNAIDFNATNEAWRFTGVAAPGDYTYTWTPSATLSSSTSASPVASPISTATTFTVTATDPATGCYKRATTTVNIGAITGTISANTQVCSGSTANVIITGPGNGTATYKLNGGSPVVVSLNPAGLDTIVTGAITSTQVYSLISVASGACSQTITGQNDTITAITPPTVSLTPTSGTYCYGSGVALTASGTATSYTWSPSAGLSATTGASVSASPSVATTYTLTASIGACQVRRTTSIGLGAPFSVAAVAVPTITCTGGSSTLSNTISNTDFNTVTSITYSAVSTAGTSILSGEDDNNTVVTIPFTFFFYGTGYTSVSVCTNGFINFGTPTTDLSPYVLPDVYAPEGTVALFMHDLDLTTSGNIKYQTLGTAPNRKFVISYNNVPDFDGSTNNTGQIILYETSNIIDLLISHSVSDIEITTGVQNLTGTVGVAAPGRNGEIAAIATAEAWRFTGVPTSGYSYTWAPSGIMSSSTSASPTASPISATTVFTLTATDAATGCANLATTTVNVGALPGSITGSTTICAYNTTNITIHGPGYATATYTINGGPGLTVTLDSSGTAVLATGSLTASATYALTTITSGICVQSYSGVTATVTVNPAAGPISGSSTVCTTSATTLTNPTSGGTWTSSLATRATVNSSTGAVTGLTAGAVTISYTVGACPATTWPMTVQATSAAITPATAVSVCASLTTTLADATAGGRWSSSNTALATVDTASGVVTGVSAGSVTITYSNGCGTAPTKAVTVNTMPAAITGTSLGAAPAAICTLTTYTSYTNSVSGGTWTATPTTVGTINSATGVFRSGTATGATTINYTLGTCAVHTSLNVGSASPDSVITGDDSVCVGSFTTLYNTSTDGVWVSSNPALATVNPSTGDVTGVTAGTVTISYDNGCGTAAVLPVLVNGATVTASADTVCSGTTLHLSATMGVAGSYSWTGPSGFSSASQNPAISSVTIDAAGTYTVIATSDRGGCTSTAQVFGIVDQVPSVTVTATPSSFCNSGASSLSDAVISPTSLLMYAIPYAPLTIVGGTNGPSGDDAQSNVTIPFSFNYYGTSYTTVHICTNGFINFGAANTDYSPLAIPDASAPPGMVALFWQDLYANPGEIKYTTVGTTPNRKFVINFNSVYDLGTSSANTGQIILYETKNMIDMFITHANDAFYSTPVCGIQNGTGSAGFSAPGENAEYYSVDGVGQGWRFVTPSYSYSWAPAASLSSSTIATPTTSTLTSTQIYTVTTRDIYSSCTGNVTTKTVTVNPLPTAYTVTGGGIYCSVPGTGAHIGLSNSDTGVNYQLKRGATNVGSPVAGTGAAIDFGAFTDTTAAYTVVATRPSTTCTNNMTGSVTLSRRTSPTAYSLTGGSGCTGAVTIGLSGSESSVSYQLYNGASTSGSPVSGTGSALTMATPGAVGTYTVAGTGAGGCVTNMTGSSVISLTPTAYNVTGGTACSATGVTVGLSGSQTGVNYQLYRGASPVGSTIPGTTAALSVGTFTVAGTYKIVADGGGGCNTNMNDSAVVNSSTSITVGANPSVCQPISSTTISYSGATGGPTTYSLAWDTAAISAGFTNVTGASLGSTVPLTIPGGSAGIFSATLTVSNGYCTSPGYPITVTVYAHPTAAITSATVPCSGYSTNIVFTGTTGATVDYSIDGGSTASSTLTGGTYSLSTGTITSPHTYRLINAHNPVCSTTVDTTAYITPQQMVWLGGTTGHLNDWHTASNWSCGSVPTSTDDVRIPITTYSPVVSAPGNTNALVVDSGVVLSIDTLTQLGVAGNLTNNGSVLSAGTIVLRSSSAQTVYGKGYFNNLELNNSAGATIAAGSKSVVYRTLTLTSGNLATNDSLVLGVDTVTYGPIYYIPSRIASIPASGASISGNVIIQQYIPAGRRAYRFWSHPFSVSTTLAQVQQYIDVTGPGGAGNGFRTTASNAPSSFRYNPLVGNSALASDPGWKPFTSGLGAADSNRIHPHQGIRLFYRGAKGEGLGYAVYIPSPTIIEQWGPVNQGDQTIHLTKGTGANQDYNMVGNPYPSPVDIGTAIFNAKASGNVTGAAYFVWNPYLGANGQYMAVYIPTVTANPYYLQTNCAFQVRARHNGDSLNLRESDKGAIGTLNTLLKEQPQYVSLMVYNNDYHPYDMLYLQFNENATNGDDPDYDATKPPAVADMNFYSISTDKQKMAVDARPFKAGKVIPLGLTSGLAQDYIIKAESVPLPGTNRLYLHDKLLKQYILMQQGTEYRFSVTPDKNTQGENRFELSMEPAEIAVQNKGLEVSILPNPASNKVNISFTSAQKENVSIRILDLSGVTVYRKDMDAQQKGSTSISLTDFASGIYMVELTSGNEKVVQRLVKE